MFRSGVIAKVIIRKRSVQSPVACVMNSMGFAPKSMLSGNPARPLWNARHSNCPTGIRHARNTTTFVHLLVRMEFTGGSRSIIFLQVHAAVHARNLIAVAIEHQGWPPPEFTQAALRGLRPARMVHTGVHIRVKAIFARVRDVPSSRRLLLHEPNPHQRLDA